MPTLFDPTAHGAGFQRVSSALPQLSLAQTTGIALVIYVAYLLIKYHDRGIGTTKRTDLVAPKGWPIVGNLYWILKGQERLLERSLASRLELTEDGKLDVNTCVTAPFRRILLVTKPSHIEHIQKNNFKNYEKGAIFEECMSDVMGGGIFVVDGDRWFIQRKTTSHIFNVHTFRGSISSAIREHIATVNTLLTNHTESGEPIDLADMFFRFTLDSFVKMGFGQNLHSLSSTSPQPSVPFAEAFDYAQRRMATRFGNKFWFLSEYIPIPNPFFNLRILTETGKKMEEAKRVMFRFCEKVIDQKRAEFADEGHEKLSEIDEIKKGEKDLLSLYMDIRDEKGERLSREQLKEIILNLIIAGRDTTAQALSWCFFHLVKAPHLMEPIREEVLRELGPNGEVDYDNYKLLKQANAVFNETLRLHPSVPKNAKTAVGPDQIPDGGPRVEKGDIVRWADWEIGRDPTVWGDDCLEFKPSRWIDETGELVRENQWKFHAFNGGPRLCLGQNLATYEGVSAIVALVRSFDFSFAPGWYESVAKAEGIAPSDVVEAGVPLYENSLTLPMRYPLKVVVRRRS